MGSLIFGGEAMLAETLFQSQESIANSIIKLERQHQVNLNDRLDKMRFNDYSESEFNSSKPHKNNEVSFVTNSKGDVSVYKGDTLLSGAGGNILIEYAYVTDVDRGNGSQEQSVSYRNEKGLYEQTVKVDDKTYRINNYIYTGADERNIKLGNIIVNGLQVGLDSGIDITKMEDGHKIRASAFAAGLCPYISFDVYRKMKSTNSTYWQKETLEYWIRLEEIVGITDIATVETNGLLVPNQYRYFYKISGKRTVNSTVQEFDILDDKGKPRLFETKIFNSDITLYGDDAVSASGVRIACSDVVYKSASAPGGTFLRIKDPVLTVGFDIWQSGTYVSPTTNPSLYETAYLKETPDTPFGLRYDPDTGEELSPPTMRFSSVNDNEIILAYIVAFTDDEEVRP